MEIFTRKCPNCGQNVEHKSKRACLESGKLNRTCQSCGAKARVARLGYGEHFLPFTQKGANIGVSNPFYGKTHTDETKEKIKNRDKSYFSDPTYLKKLSDASSGKNNPMYGTSVYQRWLEKYGTKEADKLMSQFKAKQSINSSGENNPMYGKPSPQGSGNGWSGWYNGWFFRSLKELSYVVLELEPNGHKWKSAESLGIKIPFVNWNGTARNYTPDFLVNSKLLVEIKPTRLKSSVVVRAKQSAAEQYVKKFNWEYVIIDPPVLNKQQIWNLHNNGMLKFTKRYEQMYLQLNTIG